MAVRDPIAPSDLHACFDRAAAREPGRVAVDVPPGIGRPQRRTVTYADLARQSDALARVLRPIVTGESVVAILAGRESEQVYAAQLGVLKAGAAFTCLDPAFPDDQIRDVLRDAGAVALLTDQAGWVRARRASFDTGNVLEIVPSIQQVRTPDPSPRPAWLDLHTLAYVIYTSGTSGRPKGVMIEHAAIANLVAADLRDFGLSPGDRVAQGSSAAYDSSIEETWLAFAAGATLVVMDDDTSRLGPDLIPWLRQERITVFCPPPTLLRATGCAHPEAELPDLRLLYVGGEALPDDVADRWARGRMMVNGYGPTELAVTSLRGRVIAGEPVSIGVPVAGLEAHVLDDALEVVRGDAPGELCVSGVALARGYRNLPDLTAAKFPAHPTLGRIYRTGDLVHRGIDGRFFYHGRIDSQVKLRGYRVELEAIEARLAECRGVREAACRVQGEGAAEVLVAFVVPADPLAPPAPDDLKAFLRKVLPAYMVPSRVALLPSLLKTVGGKLNRPALPQLEWRAQETARPVALPQNDVEAGLASAVRKTLGLTAPIPIDADFFVDLGGDSLQAALLISRLRDDPATASLTVRDVYEARTVEGLARRVGTAADTETSGDEDLADSPGVDDPGTTRRSRPFLATIIQAIWLLASVAAGSVLSYAVIFQALPFLANRLGLVPLILLLPLLLIGTLAVYALVALGVAVIVKQILIGRYRPIRAPVWSGFYVRHWIVQESARLVPWRLLEGTLLEQLALRALGARIGRRVHIHRGVDLHQGGWDLLEIGDDVTVSQDAEIRLIDLDRGDIVIGAVTIERGATLDVRAGVGPGTHLEAGAYLTALSAVPRGGRIPRGERWDGIPARPAGQAPPVPVTREGDRVWTPAGHAVALIAARAALGFVLASPLGLAMLAIAVGSGARAPDVLAWLAMSSWDAPFLAVMLATIAWVVPISVALAALMSRALGRVQPGVINRWSPAYIRVWLKADLVEFATAWLGGTLFWPVWLRGAGMDVGRGCEISTIIDVVPELVTIGPGTFLADGIYLGGPRVHRGTVTLAPVWFGTNVFLGNHVVIAGGHTLPDDVLLGVCTASGEAPVGAHTAWFGHPPFALPRRELVECARELTHEPSWMRYVTRVFWELLRFALPLPAVLVALAWVKIVAAAESSVAWPVFLWAVVPLTSLGAAALFCLLVLALKWALLGRVRAGQHPLWCCWCSRWDFLYEAWGFYARGLLTALEGTLLLNWYLRAMGTRIGRRVALGGGFAQVVDPDMLEFGDDATVEGQFQAHTFEDRVLKIDRVRVRRGATVGNGAVLLYGADVGEDTHVAPHSVVMKKERLLAGRTYAGCPTRMVGGPSVTTSRRTGPGTPS